LLYHQLPGCVKASRPMPTLKTLYYKYFLKINRYVGRFTGLVQLKKTVAAGGKIMALVGSDGSGKSTLCNDLIKWLTFKIDAHYFYLGKRPFIKSYGRSLFSKTGFIMQDQITSWWSSWWRLSWERPSSWAFPSSWEIPLSWEIWKAFW